MQHLTSREEKLENEKPEYVIVNTDKTVGLGFNGGEGCIKRRMLPFTPTDHQIKFFEFLSRELDTHYGKDGVDITNYSLWFPVDPATGGWGGYWHTVIRGGIQRNEYVKVHLRRNLKGGGCNMLDSRVAYKILSKWADENNSVIPFDTTVL